MKILRPADLAARVLHAPISVLSIIDADPMRVRCRQGVDAAERERDVVFCATTNPGTGSWTIRDTHLDPRPAADHMLAGSPCIRSNAAAPRVTRDGHCLGAPFVCVTTPRHFSSAVMQTLTDLAQLVTHELDARLTDTAHRRRRHRDIVPAVGRLLYDGAQFEFEDRLLAHLQVVISSKLRRSEPFFLSWTPDASTGDGRHALWVDSGVPIHISYAGHRSPSLNRAWIEKLALAANSSGGLVITDEPAREDEEWVSSPMGPNAT